MPSFFYKAKNVSSQTVFGRIQAQDQDEALEIINQQGLVPVSIEEESAQGILVSQIRRRRVSPKELYVFTKQMAGLTKSSVALLKSLEVIAAQIRDPYFAKVIADITMGVKTGRPFSSCLEDYPNIFAPLYVSMIRSGEEMGSLREILHDLALLLKKQQDLSSKVKAASVYPLVMLLVGMASVCFILTFVMPKISAIFAGTNERLPLPTVLVMGVSHFLQMYWAPLALGVIGLAAVVDRWRSSAKGKILIGAWLLRTPYFKDVVLKMDLARFSRTLYLLLQSGMTLVRAIDIAAGTIDNPQLKADILLCSLALSAGENLGNVLKNSVYVPALFVQTLTVAEEGGELEGALKDMAESCEADVEEALKIMTSLIEPLMILAVGAVVGLIIFAMLLPIFSMDIMAR